MNTKHLLTLLNDPTKYQINKLDPRAYKETYTPTGSRASLSLNGEYEFQFVPDIEKRDEFFWKEKLPSKIQVPSEMELQGFGQIQYVNTQYPWDGVESVDVGKSPLYTNYAGQYRKKFHIKNESDKTYILNFKGVESAFNVWVNGNYVGYSTDSYTTAEFDITDSLTDGENILAIEVYKYSASSWLEDQDFWRLSGIFRDIELLIISNQSILDYQINYDLNLDNLSAEISISVEKNGVFPITLEILDENKQIFIGTFSDSSVQFKMDNLKLWSAEIPNLYRFVFKTETEQFEKKIGFRKIEIKDKVILFNGKRIIFKGINRHEFDAHKGRALSYQEIEKDLTLLKKHHFNAIRCSHYPNHPLFYELCDEMGFYVIDEVNLETHGTWLVNGVAENDRIILPDDHPKYRENVLRRAKNLYERDKNCTCVLFWSLGNESYGGKTLLEMHRYFKKKDPNRLVHYEGVFWDRRFEEISDVESRMYATTEQIEDYFNSEYNKPFLLCEYSHAMGNSNGDFDWYLDLEDKYTSYHGGFIWEYMDQAIFHDGRYCYGGDFGDRPTDYNFICDGLVGPDREITNELKYVSRLFNPIKITENIDTITIYNKNLFKTYSKTTIKTYQFINFEKNLIEEKEISLLPQTSIDIEKYSDSGLFHIEIYDNEGTLLQNASYGYFQLPEKNHIENPYIQFTDGDCNFGVSGTNWSVLFSKVTNNLISIKIEGQEIFNNIQDTFKPTLWRTPTNNDIGAGKDKDLSVLHNITYYQNPSIQEYQFKNNQLSVVIDFTHRWINQYHCRITYKINEYGEVLITQELDSLPIVDYLFQFGLYAKISKSFDKYSYLGNGPIDSYVDRKKSLLKDWYCSSIVNQTSYLYPQSYGNKTDVDFLRISSDNINVDFEGNSFEFSLLPYSDNQLENTRNRADLHVESPFLKILSEQTGVGGDDSWGLWAKESYRVKPDSKRFSFKINLV